SIVSLTKEQLDELEKSGGSIAKLRDVLVKNDEGIEHIIVKNTPGENFLKEVGDHTAALNYRRGYYSVHYKDPYFVRRKIKDKNGKVIKEETFATAPTKRRAEMLAKARAEEEGLGYGDDIYYSPDMKNNNFSDENA